MVLNKDWRYTDVPVTRVANVPSHMVVDHTNRLLYFIDGGSKQVKRLDMNSGAETGNLTVPATSNEPLAGYKRVEGATVEVVDTWTTQPCGMDYSEGRLLVSDHTTGEIRILRCDRHTHAHRHHRHRHDHHGRKVGPDGRIWYVHNTGNKVVRIDPLPLANDAAISAIITPITVAAEPKYFSIEDPICGASVTPEVTLANRGSNDIASVDIHYTLNDGAATVYT
ncbi:MAG: hypothetical protein IPN85_05115 [Flavobacteriales bacterium]|nr:hypothetical protein [Flavobacteriales bacterium]